MQQASDHLNLTRPGRREGARQGREGVDGTRLGIVSAGATSLRTDNTFAELVICAFTNSPIQNAWGTAACLGTQPNGKPPLTAAARLRGTGWGNPSLEIVNQTAHLSTLLLHSHEKPKRNRPHAIPHPVANSSMHPSLHGSDPN